MAFKTKIINNITSTSLTGIFTFDVDVIIVSIQSVYIASIFSSIVDGSGNSVLVNTSVKTAYPAGTTIFASSNGPAGTIAISYYYEDTSTSTINPAGTWNSTITYPKNSVVYVSSTQTSYICNAVSTGQNPVTSSSIWQPVLGASTQLSIPVSSEIITDTTGFINTTTTSLALSPTLSNKTLYQAKFTGNSFLSYTGTYAYTLPSTGGELVTVDSVSTLTNKTITSSTITNPTISGASVQFNGGTFTFDQGSYLKDSVYTQTITAATTNISINNGNIQKLTLASTPAAYTFNFPAGSLVAGASILLIVTTGAASQTLGFTGLVKQLGTAATLSTTTATTDIYSAVCDGSFWYIVQSDKGFA